jgi:hypothetical protein
MSIGELTPIAMGMRQSTATDYSFVDVNFIKYKTSLENGFIDKEELFLCVEELAVDRVKEISSEMFLKNYVPKHSLEGDKIGYYFHFNNMRDIKSYRYFVYLFTDTTVEKVSLYYVETPKYDVDYSAIKQIEEFDK